MSDEVYENLVYDGNVHTRIATLPGMWNRTLTLSSAGKTFSVTGEEVVVVVVVVVDTSSPYLPLPNASLMNRVEDWLVNRAQDSDPQCDDMQPMGAIQCRHSSTEGCGHHV